MGVTEDPVILKALAVLEGRIVAIREALPARPNRPRGCPACGSRAWSRADSGWRRCAGREGCGQLHEVGR